MDLDQVTRGIEGVEVVKFASHEAIGPIGTQEDAILGFWSFQGTIAADAAGPRMAFWSTTRRKKPSLFLWSQFRAKP